MNKQFIQMNELFEKFRNLNTPTSQSTFIERCKYPNARLEEIISRLLAFYLHPFESHNLGSIVLDSLIESMEHDPIKYTDKIKIDLEVLHENKRIDLLITDDNLVIAIENKLLADTYNPFDIYENKVNNYNVDTKLLILLTLKDSYLNKKRYESFNFKKLLYRDFFYVLSKKLENISNNKHKYFIQDMMMTLKNMDKNNIDKNMMEFVISNRDTIEDLISTYNRYSKCLIEENYSKLKEVYNFVENNIVDDRWWLYEKISIGIGKFEKDGSTYGLSLYFDSNNVIKITLTFWTREAYLNLAHYFESLDAFKNRSFDIKDHMHYLTFYESQDYNFKEVCNELNNLYNLLVEI